VLAALERRVGDLSPGLQEAVSVRGRETEERAQTIAGLLGEALHERLPHDLVLVLDDVHELGAAPASARLIDALTRNAPATFHVILASRAEPPFPIERLRGQGQVLELRGAELAFAAGETADLLAAVLGPDATTLAPAIQAATAGWPAAVHLAIENLRTLPATEHAAAIERLAHPAGPIFSYLAQEVFAREPQEVQELIRLVAPLERFTAELCSDLGAARAEETLAGLARRGLFVEPYGGDGWFSLAPLVREFALRTWPPAAADLDALHRRVARWFEEHGALVEALHSLAAARDHNELGRLLVERSDELLAEGAAEAVAAYGEVLPADLRAPAVQQVIGQAYTVSGDLDRALEWFQQAGRGAEPLPLALAWRIALAQHLRDDLEGVVETYRRSQGGAGERHDEALLMAWVAVAQRRRGDREQARALAQGALEAALESGDDRALAAAHVAVGASLESEDPEANAAHYRHALAAAERAGDILQLARCRNNIGSMLLEQGSYQDAIEQLELAVRLAEVAGFAGIRALALMNRGLAHWCLGRLDEASADYEASMRIYRDSGSREVCYAVIGRGDVYRERGDLALARAAYEEGLALAEQSGDLQGLVPALYQLGKVLVNDEPERALELAERAVSYGWPDRAWALNAVGWILLACGERERAADVAERAGAAARELRDRFGLAESLELSAMAAAEPAAAPAALESARAVWRELGNSLREATVELALARLAHGGEALAAAERAGRKLRSLGVRVSAAGPAGLLRTIAHETQVPVAIKALGGFQVVRAGEPIPLSGWQSKKARDLLKILVARLGRPVPRDVVMDALWPDEEPAKLANRLSVALSTLRSVLDPEKRFTSEQFVRADKDAVALEIDNVALDVHDFLTLAAAGTELRRAGRRGEAVERLELAEAEYAGDFLEEDRYEDWTIPLREEARATYVAVARSLADEATTAGDHDAAARYLLRVLEKDAYDEKAHLQLAATLSSAGRHGDARRSYQAYVSRMEELGIEAAPFPAGLTRL
jgi:ATP/maltotriose-dependent transcriptional regulator MalT/DNA-binding SARP family transcriptional activator